MGKGKEHTGDQCMTYRELINKILYLDQLNQIDLDKQIDDKDEINFDEFVANRQRSLEI